MDYFLQFRTVYLQAIALAWKDTAFYDQLVTPLGGNPQNTPVKDLPTAEHPFGPDKFPVLRELGYFTPFKDLFLAIVDAGPEGAHWDEKYKLEWIGKNGLFIIKIPKAPAPEQQAEALGAYYRRFPTFIGQIDPRIDSEFKKLESEIRKLAAQIGQLDSKNDKPESRINHIISHPAFGAPKVSEGHTLISDLHNFSGLTLRILALAWNDERFRTEITNPSIKDASELLAYYFGFHNPWNFYIRFEMDDNITWSVDTEDPGNSCWNIDQKVNIVVLNFPKKPNGVLEPIALSLYNDTGPPYPFTCS